MKKRMISFILSVWLTGAALLVPVWASPYPDVADGDWYAAYVQRCTGQGIFNGFEDGTFRPSADLRRGEFVKMLSCAAGYAASGGSGAHWAEPYWHALNNRGLLDGTGIYCTADCLQQTISRYEMALLIWNFVLYVRGEGSADVSGADSVIPDYGEIPENYRNAVAQVYAKGIINGMINTSGVADGSFCGSWSLTRAQAAAVMVRLLDGSQRTPADLSGKATPDPTEAPPPDPPSPSAPPAPAETPVPAEAPTATPVPSGSASAAEMSFCNDGSNPYRLENAPNGSTPFAIWARNQGLMNSWGRTSAELNQMLTGHADRPYFTSVSEASPYMATVTVNVWRLDSAGHKYASTANVTVHKLLAADVYDIFQQIFNDPEQFPILSLGGLRCNDTMRHAYGAAIDVNSDYNCQGSGFGSRITCGRGWWPLGTEKTAWAGSLKEASAYSIGEGSSVVNAFAAYGWGWLCQQSSGYADYMHFSFRSDGG